MWVHSFFIKKSHVPTEVTKQTDRLVNAPPQSGIWWYPRIYRFSSHVTWLTRSGECAAKLENRIPRSRSKYSSRVYRTVGVLARPRVRTPTWTGIAGSACAGTGRTAHVRVCSTRPTGFALIRSAAPSPPIWARGVNLSVCAFVNECIHMSTSTRHTDVCLSTTEFKQ